MHVDLNLLVALDALIEHQSVQGAAAALHVTPPAMSHTLRRLREATGDDVLVRNGRYMIATPQALQVRDAVRDLVAQAAEILAPQTALDLSHLERSFRLRGNDALIAAVAPPLLAEVASTAPGVVLHFLSEQPVDDQDLARGVSDIEIGNAHPVTPAIRGEMVGEGRLAVAMRLGHPLATTAALSLADFAAATHVVVSRRGRLRGPVDDALALHRMQRRILASLPTTAIALDVVARSDALAVVTTRSIPTQIYVVRPLPVDLPPLEAMISWHRRHDTDLAHRWLRERVAALLRDHLTGPSHPLD